MPPLTARPAHRTIDAAAAHRPWSPAEADVLVVGGGPAGLGAALGAAAGRRAR